MQFLKQISRFGILKANSFRISLLLASAFSKHLVKVPPMGDSINDGILVDILVKKGQLVNKDDVLGTIETDKIQVDIHAPLKGVILEISAK